MSLSTRWKESLNTPRHAVESQVALLQKNRHDATIKTKMSNTRTSQQGLRFFLRQR
jgi:hypothetical protein